MFVNEIAKVHKIVSWFWPFQSKETYLSRNRKEKRKVQVVGKRKVNHTL